MQARTHRGRRLSLGALLLGASWLAATGAPGPVRPFESPVPATPRNRIDELVFNKWRQLGIKPPNLCSDAVFLRRAYLDAIGTLPAAQEARDFLLDPTPGKRQRLIDRLLARDEYADYWAMKWCDLLRVKAEYPINLWPNAVQAYHRWIRSRLKENCPYDRFVRDLLTASGSNFRSPPVNFYRAMPTKEPQGIAQVVALTFMGARVEKWPKERWSGLAGFFTQVGYKATEEWKEEIVFFDPTKAATNGLAVFPDGTPARLTPGQDPREAFADWLINPQNPWFNRNIVNRIWSWLLGRGIVQEPDDLRPDNPPSNPELLAFLEREFVDSHSDLKRIYGLILNSTTYQLSSLAQSDRPEAGAQFAHYPLRRIEAEVLADALNEITGSTEKYSSAIPEPYTFIPEDQRTIALADGSITSPFLEMFGRPPRDTGLESERNNRPSAAQRLYLLNSSHIQRKLEQSRKLQNLIQAKVGLRQMLNGLYLTILSRFPTDEEFEAVQAYANAPGSNRRRAALDTAWALINSAEFLYRH